MSANPRVPDHRPTGASRSARRSAAGAIERLYALWIAGMLVLSVVIVLVVFSSRSTMQRQTRAIEELSQRIVAIEGLVRESASAIPPRLPESATPATRPALEPVPPTPIAPPAPRPEVPKDSQPRTDEHAAKSEHVAEPPQAAVMSTAQIALRAAEAAVATQRFGDMPAAIESVTDLSALTDQEKLRLGRVLIVAEQWRRLSDVLDSLGVLPEPQADERDLLRAVALIQTEELPESMALLDYLAGVHPDDYDILTWRGVALVKARQIAAARAALDAAATLRPGEATAWYWRGVLEASVGELDEAAAYFQDALAAAPRYAPAWEALGALALNRGDLTVALESLSRATELNPARADAFFLIALAHAKAGRREPAAAALRNALRLDASILEQAASADVLRRLFDPSDMEVLLAPIAEPDSQPTTEHEPA